MQNWSPTLALPWSPSDMESILTDALRVLEQIGIECAREDVRSRLADSDGISSVGNRLRFAAQPVRDHLEERRAELRESSNSTDDSFTLRGSFAALNYCDPQTHDVRPATSDEAARMARLWDSRGISGVIPLMPGDVPPSMVTFAAERIAIENSRHLGGGLTVTDPDEIRFLIEMNAAVGRRYRLVEQVGVSPLRFNANGIVAALAFADNPDVDVSLDGYIPMAGATCPLDPRSAAVQCTAETLAFDFACAALDIGGTGLSVRIEPFDFQYTTIVFGSPEWCLYDTLAHQMTEYLTGAPENTGRFRSVAKRPDIHAGTERTASALWQALLGARHFGAVGQLSIDEVFSPQQAVLDGEILSYVERAIGGFRFDEGPHDPVALIGEGVEEGTFVGVPDTVDRFRELCYFPEIFRHWNVGRWRSEGEPSILAEAWARAEEEISMSTHELPDEQRVAVAGVYEKVSAYIARRG